MTTQAQYDKKWKQFRIGFWVMMASIPVALTMKYFLGRGLTGFFVAMVPAGTGAFIIFKSLLWASRARYKDLIESLDTTKQQDNE